MKRILTFSKRLVPVFVVLIALAFITPVADSAQKRSQPDTSAVRPAFLPDVQPIKLFFTQDCTFMVRIKNNGPGKAVGRIRFLLYMDGVLNSGGGINLTLLPGAVFDKQVMSSALMGGWARSIKKWRIELDTDNEMKEGNEGNNHFEADIICPRYLKRNPMRRIN